MEVKSNVDIKDKRELEESLGELEALNGQAKYMSGKSVMAELNAIMAPIEAFLNNAKYNEEDRRSCEGVLLSVFRLSAKIRKDVYLRPLTRLRRWWSKCATIAKEWLSHLVDKTAVVLGILKGLLCRLGVLPA